MSVAMKLVGLCNGEPSPFDGQYRREFDPSNSDLRHPNGPQRPTTCWLITTPNIAEAKHYPSIMEAGEEWARVDKRRPIRPDGKPNRPLTALTVTFDPVPEALDDTERIVRERQP
jgi:hypothetical protein